LLYRGHIGWNVLQ